VLDWIHTYCCHGPGDVQGEPLDYDDEIRDFIIECYRLDEVTGRRVYREAVLSRPKGRAKSEIAGMVAVAEGLGPVRFDGWDADGQPVGRPVRSPLIKCLATEESQAGTRSRTPRSSLASGARTPTRRSTPVRRVSAGSSPRGRCTCRRRGDPGMHGRRRLEGRRQGDVRRSGRIPPLRPARAQEHVRDGDA
jgi:hypothetical protein